MQVRALLLAFALFGAGCRSVSEPAAALTAPPLPPLPQFVARPAWEVVPIERNDGDSLELASLGDLDGDGYDELAARELSSTRCRAALIRGRDGYSTMEALNVATSPHNRKDASGSLELAHGFVNVGDTDGDGLPEIAVIECGYAEFARFPPSGVWLLAADPWRIVKVWRRDVASFGAHVVPIGDFDGDGLSDILTVNDYNPPALEVLSPTSDKSLWRLELPWAGGKIGDLIAIGDLDGGGCPEVMLQMWLRGVPYWMQCLLRGEDGSMLWIRTASSPHEAPGPLRLHLAGDANGDGTPDLWAIGKTDFVWYDLVAIQSGLDGSMIRSAQRPCGASGSAECLDLDGDGANELVVLSPVVWATRQYVVEVVSSRTLETLVEFHCEDAQSVAAVRTPHGVRIVVTSGPSLQAFDLVPKDGAGER